MTTYNKSSFCIAYIILIISFFSDLKAATFNSSQNGNWAVASTWGGNGIPGEGDEVIIAHQIQISGNTIIGNDGGTAIIITNTGTLNLITGLTLTCKGNIQASGPITVGAGSTLAMDTNLPSIIELTPGNTSAHLQINGTNGQRAAVRAIGNAPTSITDGGQAGGGRVVATFCDFDRLGGAPNYRALQFTLRDNGDPYSFIDCRFNQCSQIKHNGHFNVPEGGHIEFIRCQWTNSVEKTELDLYEEWHIFETWSRYGSTAKLIHCDFDKRVALHLPEDYEIEDCVFRDGLHKYTGLYWGGVFKSFKRNFIRWNGGEGTNMGIDYGNTIEDCVFIIDNPAGWNPHYGNISEGTGDVNFTGCIWWWNGTIQNAEGDGFFINGASEGSRAANTVTFERNIFLPNGNGPDGFNNLSCTGFTILTESTNKQVNFRQNTVFVGDGIGGLNLGETNPATAGDVAYVKSNLFVGGSGGFGMKINNLGFSQTDVFQAANVDYNAGYRLDNGALHTNGSGKGYGNFSFSSSNIVGPNDLDDVNPQFVDPNRTPASWGGSLETSMDRLSPGGGGYTMNDLLRYIREGFRPQNSALIAAGDPAVGSPDIGAVSITTVANILPVVSMVSPTDGATYTAPATIILRADASDADGTITKVEFFNGTTKICDDISAPFVHVWNNVPGGTYQITAVATDNEGVTTTSSAINFLVTDPSLNKISNDLGDEDDFSTTAQIYLERFEWESNYNIPGEEADFIHQETSDGFWVFTEAPASPDLIKSRTIVLSTHTEFYTTPINGGSQLYLGIRYKDNLPSYYGAVPVFVHNGADWINIGEIGGEFDHQWKVAVIEVPVENLNTSGTNYRFRIGEGIYNARGIKGFLSLDRLELATNPDALTIEAPTPGFHPAGNDGNFAGLDKDSPWQNENGDPFFPIGFGAGWTGMSDPIFQQVAESGFNTLVFYNWMDYFEPYAAGDIWDVLPSSGHYGFTEFLDQCEVNGLKAIGVFQNDVKYSVVRDYFGSEEACLDYIRTSVERNKDHPALLAWSPIDEPDHSYIPDFYAPIEWGMRVKNTIKAADPNHPTYALEIGWRHGAFGQYQDMADYQGFDVYPEVGESVALIGQRADQLVNETGGQKPFIAYLKAYERSASDAYMSYAEAYTALIHGANGIFYWELSAASPIWETLSQIAQEIQSLTAVLLPPALTLDVNGQSGLCSDNSDIVEQTYKVGANGASYILSANTEDRAANGVRFDVAGLAAGTIIEVLFEDRTIIAQNGYFMDNFTAYNRHVYQLGAQFACNEETLHLEETTIDTGIYKSQENVMASGTIEAHSKVHFSAGNSIQFMPGFHSERNAAFTAKIEACEVDELVENTKLPAIKTLKKETLAPTLLEVWPNIIQETAKINYILPQKSPIRISLHDIQGRLISVINKQRLQEKGSHQLTFSKMDLTTGIYWVSLQTNQGINTKKIYIQN